MFGGFETMVGGRVFKFYASVRLDIRKIGQLKEGEEVIGNRTKVTVVKNKIAPPFRKVEFDILFNRGISREGELLEIGTAQGIVLKSGTWLSMKHATEGEIRLGQGLEKARQFLIDNPEVALEIDKAVRAKTMLAAEVAAAPHVPAIPVKPATPEAKPKDGKPEAAPARR